MSMNFFRRVGASRKVLIAAVALTTMTGLSIVASNGPAFGGEVQVSEDRRFGVDMGRVDEH